MLIFDFMIAYWHLFAALVFILFLLFSDPIRCHLKKIKMCSNTEFVQAIKRKNNVLLHIGTDKDFAKGHIKGARLTPWSAFDKKGEGLDFSTNVPISISSRNLVFAQKSAYKLTALGYSQICILAGGINAWEKENLPLEQKKNKS